MTGSDGRHIRTVGQDSGVVLFEFGYDEEGNPISVTDFSGK